MPGESPCLLPGNNPDTFKLVKTKGDVSLYERWLEVEENRKVREMKTEFTASGDFNAAFELLRNEKKVLQWMKSVGEVKEVESKGIHSWTYYVRYDMPWPASDQDCLIRYKPGQKGKEEGIRVIFESRDDLIPEKQGVRRMNGISGSWNFFPQPGGRTKVVYTVMTTAKPNLPRWVLDPFVQNNLLDTMIAFSDQLKE